MSVTEYFIDSAAALDLQLAEAVAFRLRQAVAQRGRAVLAVSVPEQASGWLGCLARMRLDWTSVQVCLTDECWVPRGSTHSREGRLRRALAVGDAIEARVLGLHADESGPMAAIASLCERWQGWPRPFDALVLEVGAMGEVAALFADMPGLGAMLDPTWKLPMATSTAPGPAPTERISLTLRGLREAREVFLLVRDAPAREAYEAAGHQAHAAAWPLTALLRHLEAPVQVLMIDP